MIRLKEETEQAEMRSEECKLEEAAAKTRVNQLQVQDEDGAGSKCRE